MLPVVAMLPSRGELDVFCGGVGRRGAMYSTDFRVRCSEMLGGEGFTVWRRLTGAARAGLAMWEDHLILLIQYPGLWLCPMTAKNSPSFIVKLIPFRASRPVG